MNAPVMRNNQERSLEKRIGIMQGRLSPPVDGQIQAFPVQHWRDEFSLAADIGFSEIEFIFDARADQENPLRTKQGVAQILELIQKTGVKVRYICADYFMEFPFFTKDGKYRERNLRILRELILSAQKIKARGIEIPLLEKSSIKNRKEKGLFITVIRELLDFTMQKKIELLLETDLAPRDFNGLLRELRTPVVSVTYDIGNSASLGYDPKEEMDAYGRFVRNVHVKDRLLEGGSVPLGSGNANLPLSFELLAAIGYEGSFILQTARGEDDVAEAKKNYRFVADLVERYFHDRENVENAG